MKVKGVRMYGEMDLRLEEFELPEIKDDEILAKIYSDSLCMSTYKLAKQGKNHKRCPQNIETNPVLTGHEFAGIIVKVGEKWKDQFKPGMRFAQQPALNYKGSMDSPGYSYEYFGGDCTYCIFPHEAMEVGALMPFDGDSFYKASLGEPLSCSIGAFHAQYHTNRKNYVHEMGLKRGGNLIIMGGCGPMGLGAVAYGIVCEYHPKRIVVTDVDDAKIARAKEVISPEYAAEHGIELPLAEQATTTPDEASRYEGGERAQVAAIGEHMHGYADRGNPDYPHIAQWLVKNCFGDYYTRGGLTIGEREMCTFCFIAAQGGCEAQLRGHTAANVQCGNDREFLIKVVSNNVPFIGYPRSLNALAVIEEVTGNQE